ncbi:cytochrome c biogenesis CcdA family protein [Rhodobium gokarnense]|uniref:Cytochrome c-type biogenesis protein n=1 Tax=Rhodobium gokarnense TaxID=364296 RepID=A0ABT3HHD6_9HYPH|nr:cytochrome c biogenesis protein CcdA [Rhodobium gokarnense]MCW2309820.1 cytochrome c-type biogenesis protein [Rhodobium gokarnense]
MGFDVTYLGAFVGGLIAFVSPCVLPIVPLYLCYVAGVSLDELTSEDDIAVSRRKVMTSVILFVLGFSTIFTLMGATATALGQMVQAYRSWFEIAAGVIIVVMGLHFLGLFRIGFLSREARLNVNTGQATYIGAYLIGLAFGFAWSPCVGPVLATILSLAADRSAVWEGVIMLALFSAGLGIPFILAGFFTDRFLGLMKGLRRYMGAIEKVVGVFLICVGVLFLTGDFFMWSAQAGAWMLDTFPGMQRFEENMLDLLGSGRQGA